MVITVLVLLTVLAIGIYETWDLSDGLLEWIFGIFTTILTMGLVFILCVLVCVGISHTVPEEAQQIEMTDTTKIIALKDNQNTSGHFYLMGGYVDSDLYYYYAKTTPYGYKTDKVKADECFVVYTDENPHIDTYEAVKFYDWWRYIYAIPVHVHYVIFVPDGTVREAFDIDLE